MRGLRAVVAATLGCALLASPSSHATAQSPVLTVVGKDDTAVTFRVPVTTSIDFDRTIAQSWAPHVQASLSRAYAVVIIYDSKGKLVKGSIILPGLRVKGWLLPIGFGPTPEPGWVLVLHPGTYRLVLLAQGPTTIRFPITAGSKTNITVKPATPVKGYFVHRADLAVAGAVPGEALYQDIPFDLKPKTDLLAAVYHSGSYDVGGFMVACELKPQDAGTCGNPNSPATTGYASTLGGPGTGGVSDHWVSAGKLAPGSYVEEFSCLCGDVPASGGGIVLGYPH